MKNVVFGLVFVLHIAGVLIGFIGLVFTVISRIIMLKPYNMKSLWIDYLKNSKYIL